MNEEPNVNAAPPEVGLTSQEVEDRIKEGKVNGNQDIKTKSVGKILFTNIFTLFNFIFIVFAVVLVIFLGEGPGAKISAKDFSDFGFLGVMVLNAVIGIIQELRAKRTIDKLSLLSAPKVTVIRDGIEKEITLAEIVLDDVILLSAGRQICADSIVIGGYAEVNESLITGEPDPVPKGEGDEVLSGSFVVSGNAVTKVIHVGKDNYATKISSGAKYIKEYPSEIRKTLVKFIRIMGIVIIPIGFALFAMKYWVQKNDLYPTVHTVIGNLVGMIPSGLVLLTSAIFCLSVIRLARHKALAQDLYVVETLAHVDTLCLDKTGTITEGSMEVKEIVEFVSGERVENALASVIGATNDNNTTAVAIREYLSGAKGDLTYTEAIPFSSKYKFSGIKTTEGDYLLGAPEFILGKKYDIVAAKITEETDKGMRVLALIKASIGEENAIESVEEILALIVISDKIRPEAPETLAFFAEQGVDIKIISGDNPVTVSKIAERAGVVGYDKYVDASTFTSDEELDEAIKEYTVFGRTTPEQKLTLVKLLRKNGHTVAMTGDGVNDVLALRESDCSIAMASGSDCAKNVSQLVLLDSNFACLPEAVAEGRKTINNLERSASLFLVKTLYNLMFALIFLFLPVQMPFLPRHMTIISMITIGIPGYLLALEPNKELVKGTFFRKVIASALPASLTVVAGVISATLSANSFYPEAISFEQLSTMCTIITAFVGFMFIAKISFPFNVRRILLLIALVGLFVGCFYADFGFFNLTEFYGLTTDFNHEMVVIMAPIMAICVPLFVGLIFLTEFVNKKLSKKRLRVIEFFEDKGANKNV